MSSAQQQELPAPQESFPASSHVSSAQLPNPKPPQRVLACVLCQQRKVKCNRTFPCNNCIRLGAHCVPATLTPRRRRRRFPERELLDRLRQYEALLRQHHVRFDSLFKLDGGDNAATEGENEHEVGHNDSDDEPTEPATSASGNQRSPAAAAVSARGPEVKNFWDAINQGFRYHTDDNDSDASDEKSTMRYKAQRALWEKQHSFTSNLFLRGPHQSGVNISLLHPAPAQIFRLWQIYLNNIDPLFKVTHTPSLQGRIIEAASNVTDISATLEALMFSIYCTAVYSLSADECQTVFGTSKANLLASYQGACEQALLNSGFLRSGERDCLTAFFLYLISLGHRLDPKSLYSMLGVARRIGQRMQIDSEAPDAKLTPLEAEMRRRLWWAIALFDARIGELSDYRPAALDPTWDCKIPLNVNDSDFRPEVKEPPVVQGPSSEALFAVVRCELGDYIRRTHFYLALSIPALKPLARDFQSCSPGNNSGGATDFAELDALEILVHDKYLRHCDPANALHFMTLWTTRSFLAKCRLIKYFSNYSRSSWEHDDVVRDGALAASLTMLISDTHIMTSPLTKGFRWILHMYFPLPAYINIAQELAKRINGTRAAEAWDIMHANFEAHFAEPDGDDRYMFEVFARTILQAWEACEARHRDNAAGMGDENSQPLPMPKIVMRIRQQLTEAQTAALDLNQPASCMNDVESSTTPSLDINGFLAPALTMQSGNTVANELLYGIGTESGASFTSPAVTTAPPLFPNLPVTSPLNSGMNYLGWPRPMPWGWNGRPSW